MSHFVRGPFGWVEADYRVRDETLPQRFGRWRHPRPQHWHNVRWRALKRDRRRCVACNGDDNLNVHHRTYERWGHELLADVYTLCRCCHELFHGINTRRAA